MGDSRLVSDSALSPPPPHGHLRALDTALPHSMKASPPPPPLPHAHPPQYLLNFLGDAPDAPNLADPAFQQLLVDVQSVKVCPLRAL